MKILKTIERPFHTEALTQIGEVLCIGENERLAEWIPSERQYNDGQRIAWCLEIKNKERWTAEKWWGIKEQALKEIKKFGYCKGKLL